MAPTIEDLERKITKLEKKNDKISELISIFLMTFLSNSQLENDFRNAILACEKDGLNMKYVKELVNFTGKNYPKIFGPREMRGKNSGRHT